MTSPRQIAANRANGRKSRGPRTAAGKAKASRNALRHGLSTVSRHNPLHAYDIDCMAKAMCAGHDDPPLLEQALVAAECNFILRLVRTERVAAIERLRDHLQTPLVMGDRRLARAKARIREYDVAEAELNYLRAKVAAENNPRRRKSKTLRWIDQMVPPVWDDPALTERDEAEAMEAAVRDLERLIRYERRAWSRWKRALRKYILVLSNTRAPAPMV